MPAAPLWDSAQRLAPLGWPVFVGQVAVGPIPGRLYGAMRLPEAGQQFHQAQWPRSRPSPSCRSSSRAWHIATLPVVIYALSLWLVGRGGLGLFLRWVMHNDARENERSSAGVSAPAG